MGWSIGHDSRWGRDIGYGVPAICDHPDCNAEIDRGLAYVCGSDPYGGELGCGLFFCSEHRPGVKEDSLGRRYHEVCERCNKDEDPFKAKPDTLEWVEWKLTHESWQQWRDEHPEEVAAMRATLEITKATP